MPWHFDPISRGEELAMAVQELIGEGGVAAVTYRSVAAKVGRSASSLHAHFPHMPHLLKISAFNLANRRAEYFAATTNRNGLAAMLPSSDFDVRQAVVWSAFRELARFEPMLGYVVPKARRDELAIVRRVLGSSADVEVGEAVLSLIEGLESALTLGGDPISYEHAVSILERSLSLLTPGTAA